MKKTNIGTFLGLSQLACDYFLLQLELTPGTKIVAGNSVQINNAVYGVMRIHSQRNCVELLGKNELPAWQKGEQLEYHVTKDFFETSQPNSRFLLIAEDQGMAAIIFLAEQLKRQYKTGISAFLGFNNGIPFRPAPSSIMMPSLPPHVIASVPLLEQWGIASRIASTNAMPGCYDGPISELASLWLENIESPEQITIFGCASRKTNRNIKKMAEEHELPCQLIEL